MPKDIFIRMWWQYVNPRFKYLGMDKETNKHTDEKESHHCSTTAGDNQKGECKLTIIPYSG